MSSELIQDLKEELRAIEDELRAIEGAPKAVADFLDWLDSSLDFAIVDIAEGSETPMEVVDSEAVLERYKKYLAETHAVLQSELQQVIQDCQSKAGGGIGAAMQRQL